MMLWEIEELYDEYLWDCEEQGIEPITFGEWMDEWY
jgi:hypothetical protein